MLKNGLFHEVRALPMEVKNILFIDGYGPCAIISLLQALIHLPYAIYSLNDMDLFYVGLTHTGEGCEKQ